MTLIEIHIAPNGAGQLQQTKKIKPQQIKDEQALERIRACIKSRYAKRNQDVNVFFVWYE